MAGLSNIFGGGDDESDISTAPGQGGESGMMAGDGDHPAGGEGDNYTLNGDVENGDGAPAGGSTLLGDTLFSGDGHDGSDHGGLG